GPANGKQGLFPKASAKVPFSQNREPSLKMLCVTYKLSRLYHCLWQSQKQYVFCFNIATACYIGHYSKVKR
ncbi:MAG: hypothetical protein IIU57_00410, partial [Oscillospiraceae bacterium]|nr:hypothetical protein [Oscillospiraceae bacterium]